MTVVFLLLAAVALLGAGGVLTMLEAARIEAAHPAAGFFIEVDGGRLHALEIAPPPGCEHRLPIVLVHGASGNLNDLRLALGDRLARDRRVILVDRPGHGWSDRPGGAAAASPARQAALIMEALERIGVQRFYLLGHSLGGAVASAMALQWPERLAGLVLLAPVTHPWEGGIDWYNVILSTPVVGRVFAHTVAVPLSFLMLDGGVASVFAPQSAPADYVRRAAIRLLLRPDQFVANAQDIAALKAFVSTQVPRYAELGVPTVILSGTSDGTVAPSLHSQALAAAVPDARLIMLAGIGHMPHHTSTDRVVAAVELLTVDAGARRRRPPGRQNRAAGS